MNDFSKKTIKALAKKGITLIGLSAYQVAFGDWQRVYVLNDNGTQIVREFLEVLALAK